MKLSTYPSKLKPKFSVVLCLTIICFISSVHFLFSQSSFGGHPFKVKWNQINTEFVRVIYPDSMEEKAQRVANIIHYMNNNDVGLLGEKKRKVDIILQNQQAISNGFAQIAPFKTEFFMQAPQNTFGESSVDWTDLLALHEYRHINQFINHKRGIGKLVSWLFGDYGWGAMIGISAPAWFVEGDATIAETALSTGGRGRVPSFTAFQRAMLEEDVQYRYMKAMNGSYKDFVPNHYNTGYLILSEIRRSHGNSSFDRITRDAARLKGVVYPFSKAIKRETGKKIKAHYFAAQENLGKSIPDLEIEGTTLTEGEHNNVVNYNNPIIEGGEVYFSKTSRRALPGIYRISDGGEELVVRQGIILDEYFAKNQNLYAWVELQRDIRWGNQNFSNIILYDGVSKRKRIIGAKKRYFSPSFSSDGKNLVFVDATAEGYSGISMMNIENNAKLSIIRSKEIQFFYPVLDEKGEWIYTFLKKGHRYALGRVNMQGKYELLSDWDDIVFGPIKLSNDHLFFHANYEGVDNIYALNLQSNQLKKVSDDPIGLYNPSNFADGRILAARPSSKGFMLHEIKTNSKNWRKHDVKRLDNTPYYIETKHLEPVNILSKVPNDKFPIERYPGTAKMLNPHSWFVLADGDEISASLISTNVLNNTEITPTYRYNTNVGASFLDLDITYGKWFPFFAMQYSYGFPRVVEVNDGERSVEFSQHTIQPSIIVPLTLTKGLYSSGLTFSNSVGFNYLQIEDVQSNERFDQESTTINNTIRFTRTKLRPIQNYYPRWGIGTIISNRHRLDDSHNVTNISNDLYIPGFHVNHGFKFEVNFALKNETSENRVALFDRFAYAHGFTALDYDNIIGFNTNYGMPIAYPDLGFWDFIYFKRVNSVLFHNFNRINFEDSTTDVQSLGLDLLFDVVFINNIFSEISVGFRNAYMIGPLPEGKNTPYHFEFIIDIPAF